MGRWRVGALGSSMHCPCIGLGRIEGFCLEVMLLKSVQAAARPLSGCRGA